MMFLPGVMRGTFRFCCASLFCDASVLLAAWPAASVADVMASPERKSLRFTSPHFGDERNAEGYHFFWDSEHGFSKTSSVAFSETSSGARGLYHRPTLSASNFFSLLYGSLASLGIETIQLSSQPLRRILVSAEAQHRGNLAGFFQIRITVDKPYIRSIAQCQVYQRVREIAQDARFMGADSALLHHACIQMVAAWALHGFCFHVACQQECLHLLALQGVQHVPQSYRTAGIALRF